MHKKIAEKTKIIKLILLLTAFMFYMKAKLKFEKITFNFNACNIYLYIHKSKCIITYVKNDWSVLSRDMMSYPETL